MEIAIGCDAYGYDLKTAIYNHLLSMGHQPKDYGVSSIEQNSPYYEIAAEVAQAVSSGTVDRGILVCGTGMGMSIIANKFPGVYAAVCENSLAAKYARSINNSNVITLGKLITPPESAFNIIETWLTTKFTSGWEEPIKNFLENSVEQIRNIEARILKT